MLEAGTVEVLVPGTMLVPTVVVSSKVVVLNQVWVNTPVELHVEPGTVTVTLDVFLVGEVETLLSETLAEVSVVVPTEEIEVAGPIPVMIVSMEVLKPKEMVMPCSSEVEDPDPVVPPIGVPVKDEVTGPVP